MFNSSVDNEQEHILVRIEAIDIITNLFVTLEKRNTSHMMNNFYGDVISRCLGLVLNPTFLRTGKSLDALDKVCDIAQHCDRLNLREINYKFADQVLSLLCDKVIIGTVFSESETDILVNNFGGLLQVFLINVGSERVDQPLV